MEYREALFYNQLQNKEVECILCPHNCKLKTNEKGKCGVRKNIEGKLFSECYGNIAALGVDNIESRSLYHFYPGSNVMAIGTNGCNLRCSFCQNQHLSQNTNQIFYSRKLTPDEISELALRHVKNIGVAFTYNEPTIFYEFLKESAQIIHDKGLKNVMITNGFINSDPLLDIVDTIDAFCVSIKGFSDQFYENEINESQLQPVLDTIKRIHKAGKHLEVIVLLTPKSYDKKEEFVKLVDWIADEINADIPLHIHRFYPNLLVDSAPTSLEVLEEFRQLAIERLNFVYLSNIEKTERSNTVCPDCMQLNVDRSNEYTRITGLTEDGKCSNCNRKIMENLEVEEESENRFHQSSYGEH
jgi:pyruvate formate lyase activating enzyme